MRYIWDNWVFYLAKKLHISNKLFHQIYIKVTQTTFMFMQHGWFESIYECSTVTCKSDFFTNHFLLARTRNLVVTGFGLVDLYIPCISPHITPKIPPKNFLRSYTRMKIHIQTHVSFKYDWFLNDSIYFSN